MMVVTEGYEVPRGPTLGDSYELRPDRTPQRTLGFAPLVANAHPPRLLFDVALSGLHVGHILDFPSHHVSDDDEVDGAQWLEQPAASVTTIPGLDAAQLARYTPNSQDNELRHFSMQTVPLCPSSSTFQQRRNNGSAPFILLQRARMADVVPHLLENSRAVHVSISLSPPRANGTVPAADNGNSEFNYINETWAARLGFEWTTQDVAKISVHQVSASEMPCSIVGCVTLSVHRDLCQPILLPFFAFRPDTNAHHEKMILSLRGVPTLSANPNPVRNPAGRPIRPSDGSRVSVFGARDRVQRMPITHGETDAAAASGTSKGQRHKENRRPGSNRALGNGNCSGTLTNTSTHPVSLAFVSVLGYLGKTLRLWGILPLSMYAPQLDFLSAVVTAIGRGVPLSSSSCKDDVQGTSNDCAPLSQ